MDRQRGWNISTRASTAATLDKLAKSSGRWGDKGAHCTAALELWLALSDEDRENWLRLCGRALADSSFGDATATLHGEVQNLLREKGGWTITLAAPRRT
jgi:hypothetical protein